MPTKQTNHPNLTKYQEKLKAIRLKMEEGKRLTSGKK